MAFFLKPNEELVGGTILDVIVLAPDEAILLRCNQVGVLIFLICWATPPLVGSKTSFYSWIGFGISPGCT
jgi:hypothetical protein